MAIILHVMIISRLVTLYMYANTVFYKTIQLITLYTHIKYLDCMHLQDIIHPSPFVMYVYENIDNTITYPVGLL
jgi:hypothetical protein